MADGAHLGLSSGRALDTIIGGKDEPLEGEYMTPEQVRERIMAAPDPMTGKTLSESNGNADLYSIATDAIAKAFLLVVEEDPSVLERTKIYTPENTDIEELWGKEADAISGLWEATTSKYPGFDNWIGGASGFMVGFAYNTVLYILGKLPASNPALLTIGEDNEPA